jgi:two-component system, chemotaxis family, chemotaxis protein CheY
MRVNRSLPALVIDDFNSVSSITARVLNAMGFQRVETAETGQKALEMAQSRHYGLVLSDLHMKPMSGLELLRRMKADRRTASVPIVILTGDPLASVAESARKAGVLAVVERPPTPGELRERLEEAILSKPAS